MLIIFYLFMSLIGVMLVLNSTSPLGMWMGMEISTFFFLPVFMLSHIQSVSGWKYFIIQGLSSFFFFWGWVVGDMQSWTDSTLVILSMMIKLSGFPFYGWILHLTENLSWSVIFLLGSVQKIAPLIILSKIPQLSSVVFLLCFVSFLSLVVFFLTDFSIRWMMMFSSLFNITWLLLGSVTSPSSMLIYMFIYFLCNLMCISYLSTESYDSFSSSFKTRSVKMGENIPIIILFLFLSGIPPLGTFLGKVELVLHMMSNNMVFLPFLAVICSAMVTYFYLKITYHKGLMSSKVWIDSFSPKWFIPLFIAISSSFMFFST